MLVTHSLTHSLPNSCLVDLIDVTLACQDAYSKLVEVVSVAGKIEKVGNLICVKHLTDSMSVLIAPTVQSL